MCTRFVYNGIDKIVGFNFDIDLSVWDHTVITEEKVIMIGLKKQDIKALKVTAVESFRNNLIRLCTT